MTKGLILLDGPDACGKTTLANALKLEIERFGSKAEIMHLSAPTKGKAWEEQTEALFNYIDSAFNKNQVVIADRHFVSEAVYGQIYRNGSEYPYTSLFVDLVLNRYNALRIICSTDSVSVVENHKKMLQERSEMYSEKMEDVAEYYNELWFGGNTTKKINNYFDYFIKDEGMSDSRFWFLYDYTKNFGEQGIYDYVKKISTRAGYEASHIFNETYDFIGNAKKQSTLFVFYSWDKELIPSRQYPLFIKNEYTEYFAKALLESYIHPDNIAITTVDESDKSISELKYLGAHCKKIVAVGKEVETILIHKKIPFAYKLYCPKAAVKALYDINDYSNKIL